MGFPFLAAERFSFDQPQLLFLCNSRKPLGGFLELLKWIIITHVAGFGCIKRREALFRAAGRVLKQKGGAMPLRLLVA
ncbi:hypothetical protein RFN29_31100 [Mesorhizobium sp. VK22B]|uniref:Transposase n=1 Tax=Mesorhizobium captivum TaxID=3072319 RepID=A0ABU4ZCH4_9HYPH|nr:MULTISPECIES: hypothetical protein [unclassified Mesorhizobium]MDX8495995.1 hypothetical protein [Mesorhizobium sp. VK22B]MDX8509126.1 hypothetical protein [Mesorhizobium sp. VK22E]